MVCSYLNNLEQGQTETAHAIRELISKPLSPMIAILDKQGVEVSVPIIRMAQKQPLQPTTGRQDRRTRLLWDLLSPT